MSKPLEYKIAIKGVGEKYVDYLILGLVHAGYEAYFDIDNENVCFTGWADDVITQKVFVDEGK